MLHLMLFPKKKHAKCITRRLYNKWVMKVKGKEERGKYVVGKQQMIGQVALFDRCIASFELPGFAEFIPQ